jgi:hypothetical protein
MALLGLCPDDPLVQTLRDAFGANILRVPDERLRPLTVLASDGRTTSIRGALAPLLFDAAPLAVDVYHAAAASLSGRHTRNVKLDLGLTILSGFLQPMGVAPAGIAAHFGDASELSFSFPDVRRSFVDVNELGHVLAGREVDVGNPAAAIFVEGDYTFLVVDSVLTSRDFDIRVEATNGAGFGLDLPGIQEVVAAASGTVTVEAASGRALRFRGKHDLAFAFTCVRLYLGPDGVIASMPPADEVPSLQAKGYRFGAPEHLVHYTPDRILLSVGPGMIELERETVLADAR